MINTDIIATLKKIEYTKMLDDDSLGRYGKMRLEHLYYNKRKLYDELLNSNKIIKHCKYVNKEALIMIKNLTRELMNDNFDFLSSSDAAEEIAKGWVCGK